MNVSGGYGCGLWVDQFPVTCSQYAKFLEDTGYIPRDPFNCESSRLFHCSDDMLHSAPRVSVFPVDIYIAGGTGTIEYIAAVHSDTAHLNCFGTRAAQLEPHALAE
eukprot:COSAG03_NODE_499_length_7409_cov_11.656088_8_plen_106_part_00